MDEAMGKFGDEFKSCFQYAFGSMLWTYMGEYTRQEIQEIESYDYGQDKKGESDSGSEFGKPEPVQHYEFDGFSIDVFDVSSGPVLSDYLEEKGLVLPESQVFTEYNNQYVAVIESSTKPPISETKFNYLKKYAPETIETLITNLKSDPVKDSYEIQDLKYELYNTISSQYINEIESDITYSQLQDYIEELVDAVFGSANFEGEVLEIELPLDNGNMFFPLGTSGGWHNNIGDIDILFKVPENKALDISDSQEAYFGDSHWYLFQLKNSNPDYDLESPLKSSSSNERTEMEQAMFISDHYKNLSFVIMYVILIILWFIIATIARFATRQKEKKLVSNYKQWLFLGLSFLMSIPGALLVYLYIKPVQLKEFRQNLVIITTLIFYPVSLLLFLLGVGL
jgi:hypothetical protein